MGKCKTALQQNKITIKAEFAVLIDYLKSAGFLQFGLTKYDLHYLAVTLLYDWICYMLLINTIKKKGHERNILFFPDDSCISTNLEKLFENAPELFDAQFVTK